MKKHTPESKWQDDPDWHILVDFSNLIPKVRSNADVIDAFERIHFVCDMIRQDIASATVLNFLVYLYDGWFDLGGATSRNFGFVNGQLLDSLGGLRKNYRIVPKIASRMVAHPYSEITGTYRKCSDRAQGSKGSQKMVDQMLIHDMHSLLERDQDSKVCVISDDEDMVPGLVFASKHYKRIIWIRRRDAISNDKILSAAKISCMKLDFRVKA